MHRKACARLVFLGLISCFILFILVLKEIEVRPAGVLGVEMLLAAILKAETLVEPAISGVRSVTSS